MRAIQRQPGRRGLRRDERIDHDHPGIAFDQGHIRQVQTANLVDPRGDLEQSLYRAQLRLPPQTRVHGGRAVFVQEGVPVAVPHHVSGRVLHHPRLERGDEAAPGIVEVLIVTERKSAHGTLILRFDRSRNLAHTGHFAPLQAVDKRLCPVHVSTPDSRRTSPETGEGSRALSPSSRTPDNERVGQNGWAPTIASGRSRLSLLVEVRVIVYVPRWTDGGRR